jgi:propionate CoA-transferase
MRAGKQELEFAGGGIRIGREAPSAKFVKDVDQVSFSGDYARRWGKPVLFVTERAVFELGPQGLVLAEVAPGLDVERDVIAQMQFRPQVSPTLRRMDERLFKPAGMGLALARAKELA